MLTMKPYCLFMLMLVFRFSKCLILPILLSTESNCDQQSQFKTIQCTYTGVSMYTMVNFGPANDPRLHYPLRLIVDTGSTVTWVVTKATKLMAPDGTERRWEDTFAPTTNILTYVPRATDNMIVTENPSYLEESSLLVRAYTNQQLSFDKLTGETIKVPIDLYFAEEYTIPDSILPLYENGILALALGKNPADVNNLFLYQFLNAYPKTKYDPMMSFDIKWENGLQQPSCFALGEELPSKGDYAGETIKLRANSNDWRVLFVSYMQLEFPLEKRILIQPDIHYIRGIGASTTYLNSKGLDFLAARIDTGSTNIILSSYFLDQMNNQEKVLFERDFIFDCDQHTKVLPRIKLGFTNLIDNIEITIPTSKMYRKSSTPGECHPLLQAFTATDGNFEEFVYLGLPFFASVYMEMYWQDTRDIKNWDRMDFNADVLLVVK